jgi:cell division protein FtsB
MDKKLTDYLRIKFNKFVGYIIWFLIILLSVSTVQNVRKAGNAKAGILAEKEKVAKMQAENKELERQIAQSQGADFIEKEVRDKLGLAKEGEAIVVLPDTDTLRKLAPQTPTEMDTLPDPNWKKWLKLFL